MYETGVQVDETATMEFALQIYASRTGWWFQHI